MTAVSFFRMHEALLNRQNYAEVFRATLANIQSSGLRLDSVRSCLAIGPGGGEYEIEFVKHCAANVSKFLAVEPDHESLEHLRRSLKISLSGVKCQVFETRAQNWEGPSDRVDLILMFQSLYFFGAHERQELFKRMHNHWLTSGGYLAIASASRTKSPGNSQQIFDRLGTPCLPWKDIETDVQKAGFTKLYAYEMQGTLDLTNPDESLLRFYQYNGDRSATLEYVRDVIKELYPEGKPDAFDTMAIFKITN